MIGFVRTSIAKTNPSDIRNDIVGLGDGTYAVRFHRGDSDSFVRVDADLPVWSGSNDSTLIIAPAEIELP